MANRDGADAPIMTLRVGIDPSTIQTIAIRCRCGAYWTERVPKEVHDSTMAVMFTCVACGADFVLQDKTLTRLKEDANERQQRVRQKTDVYDA